jgi:hypothetical protein
MKADFLEATFHAYDAPLLVLRKTPVALRRELDRLDA